MENGGKFRADLGSQIWTQDLLSMEYEYHSTTMFAQLRIKVPGSFTPPLVWCVRRPKYIYVTWPFGDKES
jgi:hypothetical protein